MAPASGLLYPRGAASQRHQCPSGFRTQLTPL